MIKYLLVGGLVLSINLYGSDNPFDLAKNMQQIEADDSFLLDTLEDDLKLKPKKHREKKIEPKKVIKKVSDTPIKKKTEEVKVEENVVPDIDINNSKKEDAIKSETYKKDEIVVEKNSTKKSKSMEPVIQPEKHVSKEIVKIEKEITPLKIEKEPKVKPKVANRDKNLSITSKVKPIVKNDTVKKDKKVVVQTKKVDLSSESKEALSVDDINITKEREEMALRVQKELAEAIKDVDRED